MKKAFRHLLATLLALAMVCALAAPVWADDGTFATTRGAITIDNAAKGETYNLYRIFKLNSFDGVLGLYSYTVEANWKPFFEGSAAGADYITLDTNGHPTWKTGKNTADDHAEFAKKALAWANEHSITAIRTQTATSNTVLFDDLDIGYYLVDTSLGSLCGLTTTDANRTITEKNGIPTVETVFVKDDGKEVKTIHTQINQPVKTKTTITVAKGALNYKLTLPTDAPTEYDSYLKITVNGAEIHNYTRNPDSGWHEITFDNDYIKSLTPGTKIVVETSSRYTANMNSNTDDNLYALSSFLNYGTKGEAPAPDVFYVTHDFDLIKYDGDTNNLITGAKFKLYASATGGTPIALHKDTDGSYRIPYDNESSSDVIEVDAKKAIRICSLGGKKYYLEEIEAPAGYNTVQDRIEVDVAEKSIRLNNSAPTGFTNYDASYGGIGVANNSGVVLPSTGGIGTTIFYVVGGLLMVGAAVLLVTKKRMQKN